MRKLFCLLLSLSLSSTALSWNSDGHVLIVDLAVDNLSPAKTRELEHIARKLETTFETDRRLYLLNTYRTASDIAKIAIFADRVRDIPLVDLFAQWDLSVPEPLAAYATENTSNWHYKTQAFYSGADEAPQCDLSEETDIASVYPLLLESYEQAEDEVSKAILLAFIIHFVADAHQPMHGISRVDRECVSDRGGNNFCAAERGFGNRCETNLHALWDNAAELFDDYDNYEKLYLSFLGLHANPDQVEDLDINNWLKEDLQEARFIYTLREDRDPDDMYLRDGQTIAYTRILLAADRLGLILDEL